MSEHQQSQLYREFDDRTTPEWLQTAVDGIYDLQRRSIPRWIDISDLPSIWVDSVALNPVQVQSLIVALEGSTLEYAHPLVQNLRTHAKRESLDVFVCKLFDLWRAKGKAIKDKWAIMAMGLLGSDLAAHKLGPLVCTWRNELKHQHVTWGLECLKAIGTPAALMELHGIAQKTRHTALKQRVHEFLTDVAQQLNLTQEELQDRIIPDCGLDERGFHVFDFGSRQFQLVLGTGMKPMVRDAIGKLKSDLPKPGAKDRAELANQAIAEWKLMKKQIAQVVKIQSSRLERAMVNERRWQSNLFESLFVRHPLMTHLAQRLVWGCYDTSGKLINTFRVTEDHTYATIEDKNCVIEEASIGIIHPLQLTVEQRSLWSELLNDYEIVQPFVQVERPLYTLKPEEETQTAITRFANIEIEAIVLVGFLERRGWTRGDLHFKAFEGANVTALIEYYGVPFYSIRSGGTQSIQRCFFISGTEQNQYYQRYALSLDQVDPIVISEVLWDLSEIAAKS